MSNHRSPERAKPITPETEAKLLHAVDLLHFHIDSGADPVEALVKVASSEKLNEHQTRLVGRMFNNGMVSWRYAETKDPLKRAEDVTLIDVEEAVSRLFKEKVFTPPKKANDIYVNKIPSVQEIIDAVEIYNQPAEAKTAVDEEISFTAGEKNESDIEHRLYRLQGLLGRLKHAVDELGCEALQSELLFSQALGELENQFRKLNPYQRKLAFEYLEGLPDSRGKLLVNYLQAALPYEEVAKTADYRQYVTDKFIRAAEEALDRARYARQLQLEYKKASDSYESVRQAYENLFKKAHNLKSSAEEESDLPFRLGRPGEFKYAQEGQGAAPRPPGMMRTVGATFLGSALHGMLRPNPPHVRREEVRQFEPHETRASIQPLIDIERRRAQVYTTLAEILNDDEIISTYPEDEIVNAFREIVTIAPMIVDRPGILRALLRKRLAQGVLEPYDVAQLMDISQKLMQAKRINLELATMAPTKSGSDVEETNDEE